MGRKKRKLQILRATARLDQIPDDFASLVTAFVALREEVRQLRVDKEQLQAENLALRSENEELRRQLSRNSQNSSTPPSADPPSAPNRPTKPPSGKKTGGQPGHLRHERPEPPPEKVKRTLPVRPDFCRKCRRGLADVQGTIKPFYVWDVPEPEPLITAFLQHCLVCPDCQTSNVAPLPPEAHSPFGPRALAVLAMLTGILNLSQRKAKLAMLELFGIPMAEGSVPACQQTISEAIEPPVAAARASIQEQGIKQADETGWRHGIKRAKAWLWTATTPLVTVFLILRSRGSDSAKQILGQVYGVLVTDRWRGYDFWPLEFRQLCWAHLKRDFQAMIDAGAGASRIGNDLEKLRRRLFKWWYWVRDGTKDRAAFQRRIEKLRKDFTSVLERGARCRHRKTAGTCRDLLRLEQALWTFVYKEGVEPTNNNSERVIRQAVIKRKISFGTHSDKGARYVERILTVDATLRQQKRNVLQFIVDALEAHLHHTTPPSLLPISHSDQ